MKNNISKKLNKILSIIRSWKKLKVLKKPASPNFDFYSNWNQNEAEYQAEQTKWINGIKGKK